MASSEVSICNSALLKIGAERITALSDSNKRAIACNEQYSKCRDEVLEAHPWNFAIKRVELSQNATGPAFGYTYAYDLPADCLRVLEMSDTDITYEIEAGTLITDEDTAKIKYIAQTADTTLFSPTFSEALALRLASDLAYHLVQSSALQAALYKAYTEFLANAKTVDAQGGGTPLAPIEGEWIDVRS